MYGADGSGQPCCGKTLDQLRIFVAVAKLQHVTRAAEALNLAQSAASAAIAALEGRYGAKLFHRAGRGIELTAAGDLFLPEARAVLARAEAAELVLSELGGLRRGTLLVQASQTIASYWLPRHLVAFRRAYSDIAIALTVGNTAQIAATVHDEAAELSFVEGMVNNPALDSRVVARDQLVIVVGPDHDWAQSGDPMMPATSLKATGCCASLGPARARCSKRHWPGSASPRPACGSSWSCRPTRACVPRWRRA